MFCFQIRPFSELFFQAEPGIVLNLFLKFKSKWLDLCSYKIVFLKKNVLVYLFHIVDLVVGISATVHS